MYRFSEFPRDGAPSRVLATSYQKPRCLYLTFCFAWTSILVLRLSLYIIDLHAASLWAIIDCCIMALVIIQFSILCCFYHYRPHYLKARRQMDASEITHCLTILHYKEPAFQLHRLVSELARQKAEGKKVLIVGMEDNTPNRDEKMKQINADAAGAFTSILHTVHTLRSGEIPGTGSNHFETQVAAELHFDDKTNVIFTKVDCNARISGDLLKEIEAAWCSVDAVERHSISFMPNVIYCADAPDEDRSFMEVGISCMLNSTFNLAPFATSFVSGSLAGAIEVGYTPPSMFAEDELLWAKKQALLERASVHRLSSIVMKIFHPPDIGSSSFVPVVFLPKLRRWIIGWVEVQGYLLTWFFCGLDHHPYIRYRSQFAVVLIANVFKCYIGFVVVVGNMPCLFTSAGNMYLAAGWCAISMIMLVSLIIPSQMRIYCGFNGLRFSPRSVAAYPCAALALPSFVLSLLWVTLNQGFRNRPLVHEGTASKTG